MDSKQYTWSLIAGDDEVRVFQYKDADGNPIDLTGYTAALDLDVGTVLTSLVCTVDGSAGTVTAEIPSATTLTFLGSGKFRLRLVDGDGKTKTLAYGTLNVVIP